MKGLRLVILVFLIAGCATLEVSKGSDPQPCPVWVVSGENRQCFVEIRKFPVNPARNVSLDNYEQMRFTTLGELQVEEGINIILTTDGGESVDFVKMRLHAGTYIVTKEDKELGSSIKLRDPNAEEGVRQVSAELILIYTE